MYNVNYVTEIEYIELFDRKKGGLPPFFSLLGAHIKCISPSQIFGPLIFVNIFFSREFRHTYNRFGTVLGGQVGAKLAPFWGPCWAFSCDPTCTGCKMHFSI